MDTSLSAGRSAYDGLLSALAARRGYPAGTAALEAGLEFLAFPSAETVATPPADLSAERLMVQEILFKYHASAFQTHAPIDAAARIQVEHRIDPRTIDDVEVQISPDAIEVCNVGAPATGADAKSSISETVAMALRRENTANPSTFTDALIHNRMLISLRERLRIVSAEEMPLTSARVIVTAGGARFEAESDSSAGTADLDVQRQKLKRKFMALSSPPLGNPGAQDLARAALDAEDIASVSELMRLTSPVYAHDRVESSEGPRERPRVDSHVSGREPEPYQPNSFVPLDEILGGALWPRHARRPRLPFGVSPSFRAPVRRH